MLWRLLVQSLLHLRHNQYKGFFSDEKPKDENEDEETESEIEEEGENENEKEIARLEHEIATAKIIESRLYIIYDKDEEVGSRYYICELVGETESSISDHKISKQSQFALELQSHTKGEKFTVNEFEFKIIEDNARKIKQKDVDALNAQDK